MVRSIEESVGRKLGRVLREKLEEHWKEGCGRTMVRSIEGSVGRTLGVVLGEVSGEHWKEG